MRFFSVINCMDGRVQLPVIKYLQNRFKVDYVDSITEAGPNLILSEEKNKFSVQSIMHRLKISIEYHNSVGVAIVGHHDCGGSVLQVTRVLRVPAHIGCVRRGAEGEHHGRALQRQLAAALA